jgi:hypothetical protein
MDEQHDSVDDAIDALFQGNENQAKALLKRAINEAQERRVAAAFDAAERRAAVRAATPPAAAEEGDLRDRTNRHVGDELCHLGVHGLGDLDAETAADVVRRAGGRAVAEAEDYALHARIERMAIARAGPRNMEYDAAAPAAGADAAASSVIERMAAQRRGGRDA